MITVYSETQESSICRQFKLDIQTLVFPGGEVQVTIDHKADPDFLLIVANLTSSQDVMTLLMVTDALKRAYPGVPIRLEMPYVPYARQDRVANPGEALGARVFCDLINAQCYESVTVEDPHSDVVTALLDRVRVADLTFPLQKLVTRLGNVALVAPDAGARKRVSKLAQTLGGLPVVCADKVRDTLTGKISATQVPDNIPDCDLLVIDDICDGGRTFTELAKALRARQQVLGIKRNLYLYVTHGLFSKGLDALRADYKEILTHNDWTGQSARCACTLL